MKVLFAALLVFMFTTIFTSPSLYAQNAVGEHRCATDVLKLCKGKGKTKKDVFKCLNKNEKKLSAECAAQVTLARSKRKVKVGSIRKICKEDVIKHCVDKGKKARPSPVEIVTCLSAKQSKLTPACQKVLKK